MKKHCVELSQTGQFSQFFLDYLDEKEPLKSFYTHSPQIESFKEAIKTKGFSKEKRAVLTQVLKNQYAGLEAGELTEGNIISLGKENTFTVTTGHQLNLFTGPLYFIFKIVSTINLARKLKLAYPDFNFVPVYWMATEDHDFAEINYFKLDGKKYQWESHQKGAVGDFKLDDTFKAFLKTVPFVQDFFKEAYSSSRSLAEAVRKYVHHLFGHEGLVIVDANAIEFKREFQQVILEDLFSHTPFKKSIETSEKLSSLGYKSQIYPREINLFYLSEGVRERIEKNESGFVVLNTELKFSKEELLDLVEKSPEKFSPNVVLRPLYQEMILPNLAYLGGPAEVIYWLQLKGIFEHFDVPFPVLLPRNFAVLLDPKVQKKISQIGWSHADLFKDFETWKREFVMAQSQVDITMEKQKAVMASIFDQSGEEATSLDPTLKRAFEAGKIRSLKILEQMSGKLRKAEENRLKIQIERAALIRDYLCPGGSPQERVVNMMQFSLDNPDMIDDLLACFDPLDFRMMVLEL
jgi:bacillithiol synthase